MAPTLPSCGEAGLPGGRGGPGLSEDVAAVRQVRLDSDEPAVVVAHSYGGIITTEASAGAGSVRHLIEPFDLDGPAAHADVGGGHGVPRSRMTSVPPGGQLAVR
ncbi:alpha/beta hydrolase [Kitasatospora sp. NPDC059648]|uniref:alpha/beta hydrolase n=1 Tax=Kitasatospora sp. NPDC059648 TaxID=3346894 RepID=UPI003687DD78